MGIVPPFKSHKCEELGHDVKSWWGEPCRCSTCENWNGCGASMPYYEVCNDCKKCLLCCNDSVMRVGDFTYCRKCSKEAISQLECNDPSTEDEIHIMYSNENVIQWIYSGRRCVTCRSRTVHKNGKCTTCLIDEYIKINPDPSDEYVLYKMCHEKIEWTIEHYTCICKYCSHTWHGKRKDTICFLCAKEGKNPDVKIIDSRGKFITKIRFMSKKRHAWKTCEDTSMDYRCPCGCNRT